MDFKTFAFGEETVYVVKTLNGKPTMNEAKEKLGNKAKNQFGMYNIILFSGVENNIPKTEVTPSINGILIEEYIDIEELKKWN